MQRHFWECNQCQKREDIGTYSPDTLPLGWWHVNHNLVGLNWFADYCSWDCAMKHVERSTTVET